MAAKQFKRWDDYADEAKIDPFELPISDDETLLFEVPSGVAIMRIAQGMRSGDLELILRSLVGDQWPRVQELLGGAGHKALPLLIEDMLDHFELYEKVELVGPGGGRVTANRPREIQGLINQGYRPVGEAQSS
jgi:hypothetical protein